MANPINNDALGKLILRLTLGVIVLFHGVHKLIDPGTLGFIQGGLTGLGLPPALAFGVYIGEVVAPLMIIFGVFARIGGALVVINMIFALVIAHTHELLSLTKNGGWAVELQGMLLFCGLAILFLGSGRLALKPD